jgi:hypothetical protein
VVPEDLIGLAVWLHRHARICRAISEASTDAEIAKLALANSEYLQGLSDIVKGAADERRKRRALVVDIAPRRQTKVSSGALSQGADGSAGAAMLGQ